MKYKLLRFSLLSMLVMLFGGTMFADNSTLTIDFESAASTYTDWKFVNIKAMCTNSNVNAHGGDYFGNTDSKTTGSITTKDKISYPVSIKFYISKQSTNSSASNWLVQVSTDGETWTNVKEQAAGSGITRGTWTEVEQSLKNYSDVYVRVAYEGTTAIRCIDDLTLTYSNEASSKTATTVTLSEGYATSGIVGNTLDLPTATVKAGENTLNATVTWESTNTEVATIEGSKINLLKAGTTTIKATYAGDNTYDQSTASFTVTAYAAYASIAAMLQDITATKTNIQYNFENLLVTYVSGSYTYVNDGTNNMLLFGTELGLVKGDMVSGTIKGQLYKYNSLPEIAVKKADVSVTVASSNNEVIPSVIELNALENNINNYVTIKGATYVSADSKNLTFKIGNDTFIAYNQFGLDITNLVADKVYDITGFGSIYEKDNTKTIQIYPTEITEAQGGGEPASTWRDIKVTLNDADMWQNKINSSGAASTVYITVDAEGNIGTTENADEAAATLKGYWHGDKYGWQKFSAVVPVEGCVKITLGASNYGSGAVIVTDSNNEQVAKIDNHTGAMWSTSNPNNVAVGYYRTNAPTTLTFSQCDYIPYFAVEAIDEDDLPAEVTSYTATFAIGEGAGVVPAAQDAVAGSTITLPKNTTMYVEGKTMTAWSDGTNTYNPGAEFTPTDNVTLTAQFTENTVTFAERTEPVTALFNFATKQGATQVGFEGKTGFVVTQANVNGTSIDFRMDIDATNGKFNNSNGDWCQINNNTKLTLPACKGATYTLSAMNSTATATFAGEEKTGNSMEYTYEGDAATIDIIITGGTWFNTLTATYPVVEQSGDEPTVIYSWESPEGTIVETGGKAVASDNESVNYANSTYYTIRLNGKNDFTTNTVTITLEKALHAGDIIKITAYRNKNDKNKQTGALLKFEKGGTATSVTSGDLSGLEFVNIDTSDASAEDTNRGTEPNTISLVVPAEAAGSKTITMTRAVTSTNLFIKKIEITSTASESGEEGGETEPAVDVLATWDFVHNCANLDTKANGGAFTAETMESDKEGISMTIVYNGGQIKNNDNSYLVGNGVEMRIPVKNKGDVVTVEGYPDYFHYSVAGVVAEERVTTYEATAADVAQGYVSVVATESNNYINLISVLQKAPSQGADLVEKSIYKTDFSDWAALTSSKEETPVQKTTKYSNENLTFTFYNMGVNTGTYDETKFPNNDGNRIFCDKNAGGYITTSALANITKVRFVHAATGSNRGYKLEAKGEGDTDWVVVSESVANPTGWCEVTANVNKTNCQLRFTNLSEANYAYLFELEIFGKVDLSNSPLLGSFKANGTAYVGDDFEMNNDGAYEATFELASTATMISEENPITDVTAENGEIGDVTYEGNNDNCKVTIPVTLNESSVNYIANFVRKPMLTLTYIGVDGQEIGTQQVEKDAKITEFKYNVDDVAATKDGYKARGWFKQNSVGEKFTTESVITEAVNLYAVETEIEVASTSRKYEFNLTNKFFYAEDHEAFTPQEGAQCKFHDTAHGWSFYNGDKIDLLVGPKASIIITTCMYPQGGNTQITASNGKSVAAISEADGGTQSIEYEGEAGTLTLTISGGQCYIHKIVVMNTAETNYDVKGQWIYVKQDDASSFLDAIDAANGMSGTDRVFIYVPNGTYDLAQKTLTTIGRSNVSIIGESMEGVVIKNRPTAESINETATLLNTGTNNYFQDLTLDCIAPWGGSAERGVTLQDKGNQTICKNVYLKGLQDTYYSNNNSGTYYFEGGKIEGSVDYVCGNGDVYFNGVTFYTVNKSTGATGGCIAAPNTKKSFGYIFNKCTLDGMANEDGKYRLGRPWAANTIVRMLDSKMIIKPAAAGWGEWSPANAVEQFAEYNSVDADGNAIDVAQRATTIGGQSNNPAITETEAANYRPEAIFAGSWKPATLAAQLDAPTATLANGTITWSAVTGAAGYAIFADDNLLTILGADATSYAIEASAPRRAASNIVYTIRTINAMGGMGEAKEVTITDGINEAKVSAEKLNDGAIYTLQGVRVDKATKGIYIINGRKVVVK